MPALRPLVAVGAVAGALYLIGGPLKLVAIGVVGLVAVLLTLRDIRVGLGLFLLMAGLSPKMAVLGGTVDNVRAEDFLVPVLLLSWVIRARAQRRPVSISTPLTVTLLFIVLWNIVATLLGLMSDTIPHGSVALFRFIKYTEYFLIFFLVQDNVRTFSDSRWFALVFVAVAALSALYSIYRGATAWQEAGETFARSTGPTGENYNTLAGYFIQGLALALPLTLSSRSWAWRIPLGIASCVLFGALLYSHSREGYIMLAAAIVFLARSRYQGIFVVGLLVWLTAPILVPQSIHDRIDDTAHQLRMAQTDDPGSNSMTARLYAWRYRWHGWFVNRPILGHGLGAIPFTVDNQYLLTMVQTGLIGLSLFLVLLLRIWKVLSLPARRMAHTFPGVLVLGAQAAFVGLLVQGWAAASFGTIRTMEPFWFLMGIALATIRMVDQQMRGQEPGSQTAGALNAMPPQP